MIEFSGDYTDMIGTGLKFLGAGLEVAGAAFPGIGVLGFALKGLADAAAAAKYNKELAKALQSKADKVMQAILGLGDDLQQVCVCVCVCVCACVFVYSHVCTHAHERLRTHMRTHTSAGVKRRKTKRGL